MKLRTCRLSHTLRVAIVVCSLFVCVQLYYLYSLTHGQQVNDLSVRLAPDIQTHSSQQYTTLLPTCPVPLLPDTLRAINRATSQQCKHDIATVACLHQQGKLYPPTVNRFCPLQGNNSGEYIGCYQDNVKHRIFKDYVTESNEENSPTTCINHCLRSGFVLAGLQYRYECWCGSSLSDSSLQVTEGRCNNVCPGSASTLMCGGYLAMSVYHTGFGVKLVNEADYVPLLSSVSLPTDLRIVFVLTVNGRALRQVTRLLRAIYRTHHYYYIHVDARQDYLHRELSFLTSHFTNIRMSTTRHSTIWGGASLLTTLLECMQQLLQNTDWKWDYFLNLSESDYPLKSVDELELFLSVNNGKNFVKSHGKDTPRFIRKQGLNMLFYECDTHMWRLGPRRLQDGVRVDGGSDWVCLARDFVEYTLRSDELVTALRQYWTYSLLPAESFFHTVLQNCVYCTTVVNNNLHFTNWRRKQGCKCQYKHVVDWCGCSPNDLLPADLQKLQSLRSRPIYFARKFEAVISQSVINQLDEIVYGSSLPADTPGLNSFWLNEYHHSDKTLTNNTLLTYYTVFARLSLQHVAATTSCDVSLLNLLEATVHMDNDRFNGLIVTYNVSVEMASRQGQVAGHVAGQAAGQAAGHPVGQAARPIDGDVVVVESLLQPTLQLVVNNNNNNNNVVDIEQVNVLERLVDLQVGTDYDVKEEIFRNYAALIGCDKELVIKVSWRAVGSRGEDRGQPGGAGVHPGGARGQPGGQHVLSVRLETVDPTQTIVDSTTLDINTATATVSIYRPSYANHTTAPPTATPTAPPTASQLLPGLWTVRLMNIETEIAHRQFIVLDSSGRVETMSLIAQAWKVTASCLQLSSPSLPCMSDTSSCSRTPWSTRYPDPKSWIVSVDDVR